MIPIPFCPLHEFEVVLHLAFHKLLDGDGSFYLVFCKAVCDRRVLSAMTLHEREALKKPVCYFVQHCKARAESGRHTLQDLEILYVRVFRIDIELDLGHRYID